MNAAPCEAVNLFSMGSRWQRLLAEAGKFMAVGGVATVVALVIFNILVHGLPGRDALMPGHPITAYILANCVGMVISYHGSRNWAFSDRETRHPDGGVTAYVVINLATFTLPVACLWVSRHMLGLDDALSDNVSANVIGAAMGAAARFYLFRKLVFTAPVGVFDMIEELGDQLRDGLTEPHGTLSGGSTRSAMSDPDRSPGSSPAGD